MAERMIEADSVELCAESFGRPADAPILLIMGVGASMLWWEEGFCRLLAEGGRFVIRYDHRDTGRSVTSEPGGTKYTGADLIADAVGVLSSYRIVAAHVVGVSAGGAFALRDLADDDWIVPSSEGFIIEACRAAGFEPRVIAVTHGLAARGMVEQGLAVSMAPSLLAQSF